MTKRSFSVCFYLSLLCGVIFPYSVTLAADPVTIICPGGDCDNQTIDNSGIISVESGGVANNNTINDTGQIVVNADGVANSTTVNTGGSMIVTGGGTINTTNVEGGLVQELVDGIAQDTTVNSGAFTTQGNASGTIVNSAGTTVADKTYQGFEVSGTGTADTTTVNTGGTMLVKDGGSATGTMIEGGVVEVRYDVPADTGDAGDTGDTGDAGDGTTEVSSSIVSNTTINSGTLNVETGGVADGTIVNKDGVMNVNNGGSADNTSIKEGVVNVTDGGSSNQTTLDGGTLNLSGSGTAFSTTVDAQGEVVAQDTSSVVSATLNSGTLTLEGSASANNIIVNDGGLVDASQTNGVIDGLTVNDLGSYHLTTDSNVTDANLYGQHYDTLFNQGMGDGIIVGGDSQLDVLDKAKLSNTVLQHSGLLVVQSGGEISDTTANEYGDINVNAGGSASNTTLNDNSSMIVDGTIVNTVVNAGGHKTGVDTQVEGLEINSGGMAFNTTVNQNGTMLVNDGGNADNTVIDSGTLTTNSGAELNNLEALGTANLALADGTNLIGKVAVSQGATLGGTYDYGNIFDNANISSLTVVNGINEKFNNTLEATAAGKNLTFADGSYKVSSDGTNGSTTLNGWSSLDIGNENTAANVAVVGNLDMTDKSSAITVHQGSTLDFSEADNVNILGSIVNAGDLNMISAGALSEEKNNTATIEGNYVGEGSSTISLKIDPQNNISDKLIVNGDLQGSSELNLNLSSAAKTNEKILFLEAPNDDLSTSANFTIWRVNGNPYLWDASSDGNNWYVGMATQGNKTGVYSEALAYMGLPHAALEQTRSVVYNVINKINLRNNNLVDNRVMHSPQYRYYSKGIENFYNNYNFWIMPIYHSISNESSINYDADIMGGEAGIDIYNDTNNRIGVFASYRQGDYDFDGEADKFFARYGSDIDIDSYLGGLYFRHNWQNAWTLATVYGGIQQADIKTKDDITSDSDATEFGAALAAGYVYNINYSFNIEPSAILSFTSISYDDAKDIYGKTAEFDTLTSIEADLGVKFEQTWNLDSGFAKAYIRPSILFNSVSGSDVKITNFIDNSPEIDDGTFARLEIGGSADLSKFFSLYATARATAGSDYQDVAITAGLNYVF